MAAKMMALVSSFCCLLMAQILPTAGSVAAAAPPAATVAAGGMPALPFPFQFPFPFPGGSAAPGDGCMKAVQKAESCAADVLRSLASLGGGGGGPVGVGAGCCGVLQGVGDSSASAACSPCPRSARCTGPSSSTRAGFPWASSMGQAHACECSEHRAAQ
ncbi:hypothetical protein ACP70R_014943 [Stipagrostis hirtigluma subsp. patula]